MRPIKMNATRVTAVRAVEACLCYMGQHGFYEYQLRLICAVLEDGKQWRVKKNEEPTECRQLIIIDGRTPGNDHCASRKVHAQVDMTPLRTDVPHHERNLRVTMCMRWLNKDQREVVTQAFFCSETGHVPRRDDREPLPFVA